MIEKLFAFKLLRNTFAKIDLDCTAIGDHQNIDSERITFAFASRCEDTRQDNRKNRKNGTSESSWLALFLLIVITFARARIPLH